jgi:hypothetical protein
MLREAPPNLRELTFDAQRRSYSKLSDDDSTNQRMSPEVGKFSCTHEPRYPH